MILGIYLSIGDSLSNLANVGQDTLFKKYYLRKFSNEFKEVYIFSYKKEKIQNLPENVKIIPNKYNLHRYIYACLLPLLNFKFIYKCDIFRAYHLSGTPPAILGKIFLNKPFVFNYAYNYNALAKIEGHIIQAYFYKLIEPLAIFFSCTFFTANRTIYKKFKSKKNFFLPNGVDINIFKPQKKNIKNKTPLVLSVGRLELQKNYKNLIIAMKGINAKLLIVGKGRLYKQLYRLARKENVKLQIIKKIDHSKIAGIYRKSDIFILPSLLEGHPKTLLEAMSSGKPVIGTDVEGVNDLIENKKNGILCNKNISDINNALRLLLYNKKLQLKLSKRARETAVSRYNINLLLEKELTVLMAAYEK